LAKIGLDFGTTTTVLSVYKDGKSATVNWGTSASPLFSSEVKVQDGKISVGPKAIGKTQRSIKASILKNEKVVTLTDGQTLNVDEAIIAILKEVSLLAKGKGVDLSEPNSVRMGCPALWGHDQRVRLSELAAKAGIGLEDNTLIDEAIAAGINWFSNSKVAKSNQKHKILVFDMGGGTLDVAVLEVIPGDDALVKPQLKVLASEGSANAGDFIDNLIDPHDSENGQLAKIAFSGGVSKYTSPKSGKVITLSELEKAVETTFQDDWLPKVLDLALRRAKFHSTQAQIWTGEDSKAAKEIAFSSLASEIDSVVLVGGMSNVVSVQNLLKATFPGAKFYFGDGELTKASQRQEPVEIAHGLSNQSEIDSINIHRPFYDIVLQWANNSLTIHSSYNPLYSSEQIWLDESEIRSVWRLPKTVVLPNKGEGKIVLRKNSGVTVPISTTVYHHKPVESSKAQVNKFGVVVFPDPAELEIEKEEKKNLDFIPFDFGNFTSAATNSGFDPRIILYPSGWVKVFSGNGKTSLYKIETWRLPNGMAGGVEASSFQEIQAKP
jgi:hypothetical protein